VRAGQERSQFNEHSEALYLTSSFVFTSAAQAAARFSGEEEGNVYSRFTNPTVSAFQDRLAALEGAEACIATASGMSAILSLVMALCSSGDHIVASNGLFGATQQLLGTIMPRFGIQTSFVPQTDVAAWQAAMRPETKLLFLETPSNPLTEIADIAALAAIAHARGVLLAVDNCFCTPILQRPLDLGADLVVHSATKFLDGQGRVLGGAVAGPRKLTDEVFRFLRTAGPTLSAFNAWVLLKGLETLQIRLTAQSAKALEMARWLEDHPQVTRVYYPGLPSHPQHSNSPASSRRAVAPSFPSPSGEPAQKPGRSSIAAAAVDHRQSRRYQNHADAPGIDDARPHHPGTAGGSGNRRGPAANRGRTRGCQRPAARPRPRPGVDLAAAAVASSGRRCRRARSTRSLAALRSASLADIRHHRVGHQAGADAHQPEEQETRRIGRHR
jgi:O-succinylhomoserine sulfhydrylase